MWDLPATFLLSHACCFFLSSQPLLFHHLTHYLYAHHPPVTTLTKSQGLPVAKSQGTVQSLSCYMWYYTLLSLHTTLHQLHYFFFISFWGCPPLSESCSVMSDSLQLHGLYSPWNSLGQNTAVCSCSLLRGIFPTQGSNPGLSHCRWIQVDSLPFEPQRKLHRKLMHMVIPHIKTQNKRNGLTFET